MVYIWFSENRGLPRSVTEFRFQQKAEEWTFLRLDPFTFILFLSMVATGHHVPMKLFPFSKACGLYGAAILSVGLTLPSPAVANSYLFGPNLDSLKGLGPVDAKVFDDGALVKENC